MVVSVVVDVEDPVQFGVLGHVELGVALGALAQRLPRVLLHLDVVKLPEIKETSISYYRTLLR